MIFDSPKSVILISPQAVPLTNKMFPKPRAGNTRESFKKKHVPFSIQALFSSTFAPTEKRPSKLKKSSHTRLEVVVDDGRVNLVEVLESVNDLHDDRAAFFLSHQLILLQVEVQVVAFAVLQHCAEPARGRRNRTVIRRPNDGLNEPHR